MRPTTPVEEDQQQKDKKEKEMRREQVAGKEGKADFVQFSFQQENQCHNFLTPAPAMQRMQTTTADREREGSYGGVVTFARGFPFKLNPPPTNSRLLQQQQYCLP